MGIIYHYLKTFLIVLVIFQFFGSMLAAPDLKRQKAWTSDEKNEFVKLVTADMKKNKPMNKEIFLAEKTSDIESPLSVGRFVGVRYWIGRYKFLDSLYAGKNHYEQGATFAYGQHIFSWIRFTLGVGYSQARLMLLPYEYATVSRFSFPLGVEFALIPLGSPQTRYIILKVGVSGNYAYMSQDNENYFYHRDSGATPLRLLGDTYDSSFSIGYEWQLGENFWRINTMLDCNYQYDQVKKDRFIQYSGSLGVSYVL